MGSQPKIEGRYSNILDIPLDVSENLRCFWRAWYYIQEAKYNNPGVQVVVMEMERVYYSARLTSDHRDVILYHLIQEKTREETAKEMGTTARAVGKLVDEALEMMASEARPAAPPEVAVLEMIPA